MILEINPSKDTPPDNPFSTSLNLMISKGLFFDNTPISLAKQSARFSHIDVTYKTINNSSLVKKYKIDNIIGINPHANT